MTEQIEQLIRDAIIFYGQADWEKARHAFEEVLALDPKHREANAFLGSSLVWLGDNDAALKRFEKVGRLDPPNDYPNGEWGIVLNDWGRALLSKESWQEASERFARAVECGDPVNKSIYYRNWGLALEKQEEIPNHLEEAAKRYEAAVNADGSYTDAWNNWGRMLIALEKYDEAIEKIRKLIELDPVNKHDYHRICGDLFEKQEANPNRYELAALEYEAAVKADEKFTDAWNDWGRMLSELKKYDEAIEKFKKSIELDPKYKYGYRNLGVALERQTGNPNRFADAMQQYEAAVNADPGYVEAWNDCGRMLIELGKYNEAIEKFKKALELNPGFKYGYYNWGRALENQEANPGRWEEAARQYEAAVKADDSYTDAWNDWGRMLLELKQYDAAIARFRKAVVIDPKYQYAYRNCGRALEYQTESPEGWREAANQYEAAVNADDTYTDAWNDWARMLINLKQYDEAIEKLKKAIEIDARYKYAYYNMGWALENKDLEDEAVAQYQNAAEVDPTYVEAYFGWGNTLLNIGQYDEAIEIFKKVLEFDKDNVYAYHNLGLAFVNKGEYEQALLQYEKAIQIDKKYAYGYNALGLLLVDLNRYEEAKQKFDETLELDKVIPLGHHNLAFLYEKLGKFKQSQQKWRDALNAYLKVEEGKRTKSDWAFIGQIHAYVFQEYEEAKNAFSSGLKEFPNSAEILMQLLYVNLELKDKYSYETPNELEAIASAHWQAYDAYQKLKKILETRRKKKETASILCDLGRICKAMEEHEKAEDYLTRAIKLDDSLADAYNDIGAIKAIREDYRGAIQDFRSAVNRQPFDFGVISNLAEAYRKAKMLDQAEIEYRKILRIAPSHMDSLIGLGETYVAMGESIKDGSRAGDAEEMYTQAIEHYSRAVKFAESKEIFSEASKKLKLKELNAVYYSRGYARVALYDSQIRKNDQLMQQAQNDFRKLSKYEADENFHKAKRAITKISERISPFSTQNIEQRTGPLLISTLSFLLFVFSIIAYFTGKPESSPQGFVLDEQSLQVLQIANMPPEALNNLKDLIGDEFATKEGLLEAIKLTVGEELFASYEKILAAQSLQGSSERVWKPIEVGYLALMTFGSLIFMVAGLYLQQISRLKFGSIEIEKSTVSQISSSGALGIRR